MNQLKISTSNVILDYRSVTTIRLFSLSITRNDVIKIQNILFIDSKRCSFGATNENKFSFLGMLAP